MDERMNGDDDDDDVLVLAIVSQALARAGRAVASGLHSAIPAERGDDRQAMLGFISSAVDCYCFISPS